LLVIIVQKVGFFPNFWKARKIKGLEGVKELNNRKNQYNYFIGLIPSIKQAVQKIKPITNANYNMNAYFC